MARLNVLFVVVDSLRADHLGCYGYAKNTSPQLDALARESTLFTQHFAPGIPTTPAFTTLFSGLHPYRHGVLSHGGDMLLAPEILLLPQLAQRAGYVTVAVDNLAVQGNGRGSWFTRGFDYYSAFTYQPFGRQSEDLASRTLRFLTEFQNEKLFLFLHLWDPHTPYAPPVPFDTMHYEGVSTPPEKLQQIKALAPEYYEAFLGDMKFARPDDFDWIMAQYDGEISYADAQIGRIVEQVKTLNLWDETAIVVMSDHGECFGEGGFWFDHHGLYDANLRVTSIWRVPGKSPQQCHDFLSTEDVLPTLCELCNWTLPEQDVSGCSFVPLLCGESTLPARELFVGVECSRQASLCVRTEKWKLIVPIVKNARGEAVVDFYGRPRDEQILLFDLEHDPQETRDVSAVYSGVRDELLTQLNQWRDKEKQRRGGRDLILETPLGLPFKEFMERLARRR
jgi:arylsulfatase A-like enzyme